jgi:cysteine desulfurase
MCCFVVSSPQTILVSLMLANNETGTILPIAQLTALCKQHSPHALVHVDASQATGKIAVHCAELGCDLLTIAGHKFYAPKGVSALFVRSGVSLHKQMHGASHESDRRAGTENVALVVALGRAALKVCDSLQSTHKHLLTLRDRLQSGLIQATVQLATERVRALQQLSASHSVQLNPEQLLRVNGPKSAEQRLPNTLNVSFHGVSATALLHAVKDVVCASAGAACHSPSGGSDSKEQSVVKVSSVLAASMLCCIVCGVVWCPLTLRCVG